MKAADTFVFPPLEMIPCLFTNKANVTLCWEMSNPDVASRETLHLTRVNKQSGDAVYMATPH